MVRRPEERKHGELLTFLLTADRPSSCACGAHVFLQEYSRHKYTTMKSSPATDYYYMLATSLLLLALQRDVDAILGTTRAGPLASHQAVLQGIEQLERGDDEERLLAAALRELIQLANEAEERYPLSGRSPSGASA